MFLIPIFSNGSFKTGSRNISSLSDIILIVCLSAIDYVMPIQVGVFSRDSTQHASVAQIRSNPGGPNGTTISSRGPKLLSFFIHILLEDLLALSDLETQDIKRDFHVY